MKWYQVDSDTPNDPKIKALIRRGLGEGGPPRAAALVGHTFLLWCYVANHGEGRPGYGVKADGSPLSLTEMADECLIDTQDQLKELLDFLAEKEHIHRDTWREQGIVFLPAMQKRADEYAKKKGRGTPPEDQNPQGAVPGNGGGKRANAGEAGGKSTRTAPELPLHDTTKQDTTPAGNQEDLLADAGEDAVAALVRTWNDTRKPGPLVGKLTPQRRAAYLRALKDSPDLAAWRTVIDFLNGERWCNGQGGGDHPNWRATLDWLAKPGKLAEYLDKAAASRPTLRADGTAGRNAAKGRTGYRPGEFAAALKGGGDDAVH